MKKRMAVLVTGTAILLGMFSGAVQAKTYGYDLGEGSTIFYGVPETDYDSEKPAAVEKQEKELADWHREEMRKELAYLEKYGITYDDESDRVLYHGQPVRWLIDEQIGGTYTAVKALEGEIDVYTVRADDYALTGVRIATQEEYDERTKREEAAQEAAVSEMTVVSEDKGAVEYGYELQASDSCASVECTTDFSISYSDKKEWETQRKEYEEAGIFYDDENYCWTWNGKPVYWLVDEDGSMTTNGSKEAVADKIYLVVKRGEDGSIREVTQVTIEDAMREQMKRR